MAVTLTSNVPFCSMSRNDQIIINITHDYATRKSIKDTSEIWQINLVIRTFGRRFQHNATNLIDTLCDAVARTTDSYGALCRVWQQFTSDLNACAGHFADLLDFGAPFADK